MPARIRQLESTIQRAVISRFEKMGIFVRKKHGTNYGVAGDPDLYGIYNIPGTPFAIELKRPGEVPTGLQMRRLQEWADAGARAGWASSVDAALGVLYPESHHGKTPGRGVAWDIVYPNHGLSDDN